MNVSLEMLQICVWISALIQVPLLLPFCPQLSSVLTSEVHSVRAGRHLATKLNHLVQLHFDLASTTITNIPMKVSPFSLTLPTAAFFCKFFFTFILFPSPYHIFLFFTSPHSVSLIRLVHFGKHSPSKRKRSQEQCCRQLSAYLQRSDPLPPHLLCF